MRWGSAVSNNASLQGAVEECVSSVLDGLEGLRPDLAFVFLSAAHAAAYGEVPALVRRGLGDCPLLGCSGGGVIGAGREVEGGPGLAIAAAAMPEAELSLFHVENDGLPDQDSPPERWWEVVGSSPDGQPDFVLLADPFSFAADRLIAGIDYAFPGSATIGGLASGAHGPGGNALYVGDEVRTSGAIGVAVAGSVTIDTVVAQGCRPIGAPMQVTSCADNWLLALDGKTPVQALVDVMGRLDEGERNLARHSLFLGVAMDRLNETPSMGDFLIRNIVGVDPVPRLHRDRRAAVGGPARTVPSQGRADVDGGPRRHAQPVLHRAPDLRGDGRAALLLPGPGPQPVWPRRPRHRHVPREGQRDAADRLLLQRGDRPRSAARPSCTATRAPSESSARGRP